MATGRTLLWSGQGDAALPRQPPPRLFFAHSGHGSPQAALERGGAGPVPEQLPSATERSSPLQRLQTSRRCPLPRQRPGLAAAVARTAGSWRESPACPRRRRAPGAETCGSAAGRAGAGAARLDDRLPVAVTAGQRPQGPPRKLLEMRVLLWRKLSPPGATRHSVRPRVALVRAGCAGAREGHRESSGAGLGPALSLRRPLCGGGTGGPPLVRPGAPGLTDSAALTADD